MHNSENGQFDNSFLLDEVRCGFYIPTELKQAWAAQLEVLQAVDAVCRANNIQYFADWGTLLGAIRHRGFIPWDDDLDIVMKREDYEHFRQVENQLPDGFSIHTFRNEEGFREFHATVVGAPSVSFEAEHLRKFHGFPYMCGLDIFILDYVYTDEKKEEERIHNIKYVIGIADAIEDGSSSENTIEYGLAEIEKKLGIKLERKKNNHEMWIYLYELAEKLCAEVKPEEAIELTQMIPWGIIGKNFRFPKDLYKDSIYVPFEYAQIPVPLAYDAMLTKRYGSYLKLVKAAGGHEYPFFRAQRDKLQSLLDFDMPGFYYKNVKMLGSDVVRSPKATLENGWKCIVNDALCEWKKIAKSVIDWLNSSYRKKDESILSAVADCQKSLIDIIEFVEVVKGEGKFDISIYESCCDILYSIFEKINLSENGYDIIELDKLGLVFSQVVESVNIELHKIIKRREVVFLAIGSDKWEYLNDLYTIESNDNNTDVYVIPMPIIYKDYDGAESYRVCDTTSYKPDMCIVDYSKYNVRFHCPDRVYYQFSFDQYNPVYTIPEEYYIQNIRAFVNELVYVPWIDTEPFDVGDRGYENMKYPIAMPGVFYADSIIVQREWQIKIIENILDEWSLGEFREKYSNKVSIIAKDIYRNIDEKSFLNNRRNMVYYIDICTLFISGETYINKMKDNLDVFRVYREINITVVVETTLEKILERNDILKSKYYEIMKEYEREGIKIVKLSKDAYNIADFIKVYSAYYGDPGYMVPEFQLAGKPVMIQNLNILLRKGE